MAFFYYTATTLNGFLADDENSLQWLFDVPGTREAEAGIDDFLAGVSTLAMGSTTYEWMLRELDLLSFPEKWTESYGSRPTWVFSSRELPVPAGVDVRVINSSVADALPGILASAGAGDVWIVGGGDLAGQFLDAGALDRITLTLAPVFLPGGAPLFPRRLESAHLHLTGTRQTGQFVELTFDVTPPG